MRKVLVGFTILLISGCYAEGESWFLQSGETRRYLSMDACQREATVRHSDGQARYSGFGCRGTILGFVTQVRHYADGRRVNDPGFADTIPTIYRLYRGSVIDTSAKFHVGSFDAGEGESAASSSEYNKENCEIAKSLFQAQPGVSVRYWCEAIPPWDIPWERYR